MTAHRLIARSRYAPASKSPGATQAALARRWCERAEDVTGPDGDVFDQFVCAWIAFNALYGQRVSDDGEQLRERDAVSLYLEQLSERVPDVLDLVDAESAGVFTHAPVFIVGMGDYWPNRHWRTLNDVRSTKRDRFLALFQAIYTVRCNLFHGMKSDEVERDLELVAGAADIVLRTVQMALVPSVDRQDPKNAT